MYQSVISSIDRWHYLEFLDKLGRSIL